jgi:hypothetical protein
MRPLLRRIFWLLLGVSAGLFLVTSLAARDLAAPATRSPTATEADQPKPPALPALPVLKSPVDSFRELLAMTPAEREHFLANRPPESRKRILEKVREYEALKPDERALSLRMTELRWYLLHLIQTPPTNRAAQLAFVPEADRKLVQDHLQSWDSLSPQQQEEVLKYQVPMQAVSHPSVTNTVLVSNKLDDWNKLPGEQRQQMYDQFHRFFELTEAEKEQTLHVLSAAERGQMTRALKTFERLPQERRERCLGAFRRFAGMSEEERGQFLANAERWQEMSPADRESWRSLVSRLPQPPMPPGFGPPMPPSPLVPMPVRQTNRVPLATNSAP